MSSYLEVIRQAVILFPILAVLFTVPYIAFNYHKYGSVLSLRILIVYSFVLYLLCVYCLVILPLPTAQAAAQLQGHPAQLVPFAFLQDIADSAGVVWSQPGTWPDMLRAGAFWTTVFNLFMTMPFGVYLHYYFRCSARRTLVLSFLLSLFFELTQLSGLYFLYPGSYRIFDVDDLMVNTLGSMIGYLLGYLPLRLLPTRDELDRDSYLRGQQVSFLRRLVALCYDAGVCLVLAVLWIITARACPGLDRLGAWACPLLWTAYFMLCPLIFRGRTVGYHLTRLQVVSLEGRRPRWYQLALRYACLLAALCWAPLLLGYGIALLEGRAALSPLAALVSRGLLGAGLCFLLLFEVVRGAMRRPLFYERWTGTRLASAVLPPASPGDRAGEGVQPPEKWADSGRKASNPRGSCRKSDGNVE